MAYNLWMTVRVGEAEVHSPVALQPAEEERLDVILEQTPDLREELDRPRRSGFLR